MCFLSSPVLQTKPVTHEHTHKHYLHPVLGPLDTHTCTPTAYHVHLYSDITVFHTTPVDILHTCTHTYTLLDLYSNIPSPTYRTLEYTQIHAYLQTILIQTPYMTSCHTLDLNTATPSPICRLASTHTGCYCPVPPHSSLTAPSVPHTHTQTPSSRPCPAPHAHRPPAWTSPTLCASRNSPCCAWQISPSGHLHHSLWVVGTVGKV